MTSKRLIRSRWTPAIVAAALSLAVWAVAVKRGYGIAMIWLPGVAIGAAWPRRSKTQRLATCLARIRRDDR